MKTMKMWCPNCREAVDAYLEEDEKRALKWFVNFILILMGGFLRVLLGRSTSVYSWICPECKTVIEANEVED